MASRFDLIRAPKPPVFSARHITSEVSTTSLTYVTIVDSDVVINPSIFKVGAKLYIRFFAHLKNNTGLKITYAQLYRQHAATVVTGTEVSKTEPATPTDYAIKDSGWVDISSDSGLESYQVQMKVDGGTGSCNCAIMLLSYKKL